MAGRENIKDENTKKIGYLDNEKSFLDEIKSIFYNYLRTTVL